jgi:5-(carboxyamino)imidazole ribonucleotide synthase
MNRYLRAVKNTRIGILGGGQLARMLSEAAAPLGFEVAILTPKASDPAAQVCGQVQLGSLNDEASVRRFLASLNAMTFESEFVDTALVGRCMPKSLNIFPALPVIAEIQDRLTQKRLLDRFKIPTSPWMEVSSSADLKAAAVRFPQGFVLKQRRFGYDGNGTFVIRNPATDLDPKIVARSATGFIAESLVALRRELAVTYVRSKSEFLSLPLVESVQHNSCCFSVQGPVRSPRLPRLTSAFKRLMKDLDYRGLLAVELFETSKGLMVNELAPRVHNSAHYSQNALTCSQFEYHWRAGLDLPLPKVVQLRPGFAMVNLLGEGGSWIHLSHSPLGHLHWYGKSENREGRKLGHLNVLGKSAKQALQIALRWRKEFQL